MTVMNFAACSCCDLSWFTFWGEGGGFIRQMLLGMSQPFCQVEEIAALIKVG